MQHNKLKIAVISLLLSLSGCGGGGGGGGPSAPLVTVPSVIGDDKLAAQAAITASGFVVGQETTQASGSMASGGVLSQSPAAGSSASKGSAVSIVIATPVQLQPSATLPSDSGRTSFTYLTVNVWANAVVWDSVNNVLQVVTNNSSPTHASEVLSISPSTGSILASHAVNGQGLAVAVSADGQYVYVGLDIGGGGVQRYLAKTLLPDLAIPVGDGTTYIQDIQVSPTNPHAIAVSAWYLVPLMQRPGVAIFDDAVMRPMLFNGTYSYPDPYHAFLTVDIGNTNWSADGSTLYVFNQSQEGIYQLAVSPQGLSLANWFFWVPSGGIGGRLSGNIAYLDFGYVIDVTGTGQLLGRFPNSDTNINYRAELHATGKSFNVQDHYGYTIDGLPYVDGMILWSADLNTYAIVDSLTFLGVASATSGKLYAWGTDGIAWADAAHIIIGSGSFTGSGGAAPAASPAVVATGSISATGGTLNYQVLAAGANDLVADSCGNLYAATAGASGFLPNSVVSLDPVTAAVKGYGFAGSEPSFLAVADDCSVIYAAFDQSSTVARIDASTMTLNESIPLPVNDQWGIVRARSLSVAPGAPQTVAVATMTDGLDCQAIDDDVRIYDDLTPRSLVFTGLPTYAVGSVAYGTTAATLFAYEVYYSNPQTDLLALTADGTGPHSPIELGPLRGGLVQDGGRMLYFDHAKTRIYDVWGDIFDISANAAVGPITLNTSAAQMNQCGTPSDAMTTDATSGKLFFVTYLSDMTGLQVDTYDPTSLALITTAKIPFAQIGGDIGNPLRVVRPANGSLALVTSSGYLVYLSGSMLGP